MGIPTLSRFGAWASVVGFVALGAVACGGKSTPGSGSSTDAGTGGASTDAGTGGETGVCGAGRALCSGACVDLSHDPQDCGQCNHACGVQRKCVGGHCDCPPGTTDCGGTCADLQWDQQNCGACGNVCSFPDGCIAGECSATG